MAKSEWNGEPLPESWAAKPYSYKDLAIAFLQSRTAMPPFWWARMVNDDQKAVILHLCAVGSLDPLKHHRARAIAGKEAFAAAFKRLNDSKTFKTYTECPNPYLKLDIAATIRMNLTPITEPMLYPKPNGGKRILPSIYTKLTDKWLRATGQWQLPKTMNQGHLRNTVALLNESHVNLVDRMTDVLGRMHNHLGNRPDLQAKIVDLFHDLEILQVDELYPIVELLASHIEPELEINPVDAYEGGWFEEF